MYIVWIILTNAFNCQQRELRKVKTFLPQKFRKKHFNENTLPAPLKRFGFL